MKSKDKKIEEAKAAIVYDAKRRALNIPGRVKMATKETSDGKPKIK